MVLGQLLERYDHEEQRTWARPKYAYVSVLSALQRSEYCFLLSGLPELYTLRIMGEIRSPSGAT